MTRLFDILFSGLGLLLGWPVLGVIALVGWFDSGSPLFKQVRVGRFQQPFTLVKFRTMRPGTASVATHLANSNAITPFGRFLRRTKLDELPQLWNVFKGDMAFIGPRPERKYYIDQIIQHDPRYVYLYQLRPGVTSYATLYNGYTDTMEKMLKRLDLDKDEAGTARADAEEPRMAA